MNCLSGPQRADKIKSGGILWEERPRELTRSNLVGFSGKRDPMCVVCVCEHVCECVFLCSDEVYHRRKKSEVILNPRKAFDIDN